MTDPGRKKDDPAAVAQAFAADARMARYNFDFSRHSLEMEVDRLLESNDLHQFARPELESLLTAYLGETVRRLCQGQWTGSYCYAKPWQNYYLSKLTIGRQEYYPSHFIGYYLANGKQCRFQEYLHQLAFFNPAQ